MARTQKKPVVRKKNRAQKKRAGLLGFKMFALLVLLGTVAAFVFYVRSGGSLKGLGRVLPPALRLEGPQQEQQRFWDADIYFSDTATDFLIVETRRLPWKKTPENRAVLLMRELLRGPAGTGVRTTPDSAVLRSVLIAQGGIAQVDFSAQLAGAHPGGSSSEMLTVYSIVNTLAFNIDDIKKVQILIEGQAIDTIAGHMDCRQPFAPSIKIIK